MPAPNQDRREVSRDIFAYRIPFTSIASLATQNYSLQFDVDADFLWQKATMQADIAAAGQTASSLVVPLCNLLMTDSGSGRNFMSGAVPLSTIFGTGSLPFILPNPKQFRAGSTLAFALSNYDAANTYNVYLTLWGVKIFYA
jgi:hypothetical protein